MGGTWDRLGRIIVPFAAVRMLRNSLMRFASTELLALAVVDSLVLVGQKRDPDKNRVVLCYCSNLQGPTAQTAKASVFPG